MSLTLKSISLNRLISGLGGAILALYIGATLKFNYISFVSISSICGAIIGFTFNWTLLDLVIVKDKNLDKAIKDYLKKLLPIIFVTIFLFILFASFLVNEISSEKIFLGLSFIFFYFSNETYNHIIIRLKDLIFPSIILGIKSILLLLFYIFLDNSLSTISFVIGVLFFVNLISIYFILNKIKINFFHNINNFSFLNFKKENLVRASGLFLTGIANELIRISSNFLEQTDLNSLIFLISDYSTLILGFLFSIIYWRVGPSINSLKNKIIFLLKYLLFFVISIGLILAFSKANFYNFERLNNIIIPYGFIIFIMTLPVIFKTYIIDLFILKTKNGKYLIFSNIIFIILFPLLIFLINSDNLLYYFIIRATIVCSLSYIVMALVKKQEAINNFNQ